MGGYKLSLNADQINFLIDEVKKYPELYNNVARWLHSYFGISNAAFTLLMSYYVIDHLEEEEKR